MTWPGLLPILWQKARLESIDRGASSNRWDLAITRYEVETAPRAIPVLVGNALYLKAKAHLSRVVFALRPAFNRGNKSHATVP